ncbi:MAG: GntR family transcriptional regulator [Pikeienuella sp.]
MLDEKSPTGVIGSKLRRPGFQQIVEDLRARIARSELAEHASLPSERSLAEQFSVSRMTARRALEALEAEGLVYSQDRRGRFVSPQRLQYDVSNMVSFVADARTKGSDLDIEIVAVGEVAADVRLASLLEQPVGVPIYEYTRLFRSGGHAIFIETECVLADRFPGFLQHDLQQSTTRILETHYNSAAQTGDIVIRMRGVCEDEAKLLNISNNHAVILLEQVIRDQTAAPFCFGHQVWRGEMAEFSAHAIVTRKNHR